MKDGCSAAGGESHKRDSFSYFLLIPFFYSADQAVKAHGNDAENDNAHQDPVEFKEVCTQNDKMNIVTKFSADFQTVI